ncbi:uncharacterized protein LOC113286918 isoform X2 [Papaver somniferum]|uniref:uncharacterized protein LOC113286918 isoform X2 n=1 Tax=Papaver somniferum TaxID=3469 RepID=UPI000E703272|nr:uncharacterized protein LOC113286918 isoform X2 [Papaver somniferum]
MTQYNGHQTSEGYAHKESNPHSHPANGVPSMPSQQSQRRDDRRSSSKPQTSQRINQPLESNQIAAGYTRNPEMGIHDNHMQQRHRVGSSRSNRDQNPNGSNSQTWRPVTNSNQVPAPPMAYRQNQVQPTTAAYRPSQAQAPAVAFRTSQVQAPTMSCRPNHVQAPTMANRTIQVQAPTMPQRTHQEMSTRSHEVATVEVGVMPLEAYGGRIWSYEELRAAYGANPAQVYATRQAKGSLAASSSSLGENPRYRIAGQFAAQQVASPPVASQYATTLTVQQGPQPYNFSALQDPISSDDLSLWIQQRERIHFGNLSTMMQHQNPTPYISSSRMVEPQNLSTCPQDQPGEEELYPPNITQDDLPDRVDNELDRVFKHDKVNWSVHAQLLPNKPNALGPMVHSRHVGSTELTKLQELIEREGTIRLLCSYFKKIYPPSTPTNTSSNNTSNGFNYTGNNNCMSVPPRTHVHGRNSNDERRAVPNNSSWPTPLVSDQVHGNIDDGTSDDLG